MLQYYCGDFNIGRDKFLKHEITKDNGWVTVSTLLRCNRLAALTKDVDVIMGAFKKNPTSLVEVCIFNCELVKFFRRPYSWTTEIHVGGRRKKMYQKKSGTSYSRTQ
jgi:lupus La protein